MAQKPQTQVPDEASIVAVAGHQFPGGTYTIAHWENFLLTSCTGAELMSGGCVHPSAMFHMPILGSGTSIAEMFALGQAESDLSISIESYDWRFYQPLREEVEYNVAGGILSASRCRTEERLYDRLQFQFDVTLGAAESAQKVAKSVVTWHYNRGGRPRR